MIRRLTTASPTRRLLGIAAASYALRPASRSLGAPLLAEKASSAVGGAATSAV